VIEKREVKMTRCPPLCGKAVKIRGKKEIREECNKMAGKLESMAAD